MPPRNSDARMVGMQALTSGSGDGWVTMMGPCPVPALIMSIGRGAPGTGRGGHSLRARAVFGRTMDSDACYAADVSTEWHRRVVPMASPRGANGIAAFLMASPRS